MLLPTLVLVAAFQAGAAPQKPVNPVDSISVTASVTSTSLEPGAAATAQLQIELANGVSASASGLPGFIIQLDPPDGLDLVGKEVVTFEDQRDNEFLMEPWERLLEGTQLDIEFKTAAALAEDATLGVIVLGYVSSADGKTSAFLRRRIELPLRAGATSVPGDDSDSTWGPRPDHPAGASKGLNIGDRAANWTLPTLKGPAFSPAAWLGKEPTLVVTYRGHW